jgi:cytidine deaminase
MATRDELLAAAKAARLRAYAPYSKFQVGAAVETADGSIVVGCNVENASYGLGICAERVALTSAVAAGHRSMRAIAIAGPDGIATAPCGACRQFIAEFDPAMPVTYTGPGDPIVTTLAHLLPESFGPHSLGVDPK